jgi:hypothetical protein
MLINPIDRASLKAIYTKNGTAIKMVTIDEVECFYSENKGNVFAYFENRNYLLDQTWSNWWSSIRKFFFMQKIHYSMKGIKEIQMHSNSRLKVILPSYIDDEVIVSREK